MSGTVCPAYAAPERADGAGAEDDRLSTSASAAAPANIFTDREGERYLDLLSGFGVFAWPQSSRGAHALKRTGQRLPNLVQMDVSTLAGVLAERLLRQCRTSKKYSS